MAVDQATHGLAESHRVEVLSSNGLVADPADILRAVAETHPHLFRSLQRDDLANIVQQSGNHQLVAGTYDRPELRRCASGRRGDTYRQCAPGGPLGANVPTG